MKVFLDSEIEDRENGRKGGIKSREFRKVKEDQASITKVIVSGIVASEMMKSMFDNNENQSDDDNECPEK